ncbi:MAG: SUMF1/EgtB/PvdO family nonheme iron enzyme [Vicinamibacterales bacterium]
MASTDVDIRAALIERYQRNRRRSANLFALLADEAYYNQPIALRHPIVFYDGHLPGFSFNTLVKKALGRPGIDARLETLFARGIDPHESSTGASGARASAWPSRHEVRAFADEADRQVIDALTNAELDRPDHPLLDRMQAVHAILEHEEMHQETLLYMWHRLPASDKTAPDGYAPFVAGVAPSQEWIDVPGGCATLGIARDAIPFGWDNEHPAHVETVPRFRIERHDVTNARFMDFVDAGGYRDPRWWNAADWAWIQEERQTHPRFWEREADTWYWRGMFGRIPLPPSWPVYVSLAEASAFARWSDARLPTEAEFQRAAYGSPAGERRHPWGDAEPRPEHGLFDFAAFESASGRFTPAGGERLGCGGSRRQRMGMDQHSVRAVSRLHTAVVVSGVLGRLLRWRTLRDEGGVACHRA